jgi:hypothetical protein
MQISDQQISDQRGLQTLQGSIFDLHEDPDSAFHSNADPKPASQNNADSDLNTRMPAEDKFFLLAFFSDLDFNYFHTDLEPDSASNPSFSAVKQCRILLNFYTKPMINRLLLYVTPKKKL